MKKLNYEEFTQEVRKILEEFYSPEEYIIEIRSVEKVNVILDGLTVTPKDSIIGSTIYLNGIFKEYQKTGNFSDTIFRAAAEIKSGLVKSTQYLKVVNELNADVLKEKVVFQLINTKQNQQLLKNVPHREFEDLSIIYRMVVQIDKRGISSMPVHNGLADTLGFTEEQLFKHATENTKRLLPPVVKSMNDVIRDIFMKDGMPMDMVDVIVDMMIGEMPPEQQMYAISNNKGINGAASMLYEDILHELAEKLGSDLYITPISIHEVIAVSTNIYDPDEFATVIAEMNMNPMAPGADERLSNQVYHYNKDLRRVTLATNTQNKSLDDM